MPNKYDDFKKKTTTKKNKLNQKMDEIKLRSKQSLTLFVQIAAQTIPTFFIIWFFSGNTYFSLFLTLIIIAFNFIRIRNANRPIKVNSKYFTGDLSGADYYILVTFYVLGALSKAKGIVTKNDIQYAESLMGQFQLDSNQRKILMNVFNQGKEGSYPLAEVIAEFCQIFQNRGQSLNYFFEYQLNAAMQDGELHAEELSILRTIGSYMGMSQFNFEQKIRMAQASRRAKDYYSYYQQSGNQSGYSSNHRSGSSGYGYNQNSNGGYYGGSQTSSSQSELADAYTILGVSSSDDFDTVKKSYRKLIKQYHPDKYVSQDVPEAVKEKAKEKSQEIISAYDLICKNKGWK